MLQNYLTQHLSLIWISTKRLTKWLTLKARLAKYTNSRPYWKITISNKIVAISNWNWSRIKEALRQELLHVLNTNKYAIKIIIVIFCNHKLSGKLYFILWINTYKQCRSLPNSPNNISEWKKNLNKSKFPTWAE